ncbi:Rossmann-like domain-containing protein [Halomonas sp.]|uniref:Rossmann-like domain-containing protein n=1 Tax=Halomonas sp. TaxID=1486246 RepID=UPI003A0FC797
MPLTVLELETGTGAPGRAFEVWTSARLRACDRILCTSTVILNDTVDAVLAHCRHATQFALIGPTAGFLPDRCSRAVSPWWEGLGWWDTEGFLQRCRQGEKWGPTTRKYCLYPHITPVWKPC